MSITNMKYLFNHISEDTAYLVNDYPYGFRLRTQIRYWIETTKNGDRFCSQTLNPKTGRWNKPKKSVYRAVMVMVLKDNNHIAYTGFSLGWDKEADIQAFIEKVGIDNLSEQQLNQCIRGKALSRTQDKIIWEIGPAVSHTSEEAKAYAEEQEKTKQNINRLHAYNLLQVRAEFNHGK